MIRNGSGYDPKHIDELKNTYMNEKMDTKELDIKKKLVELENEDKKSDTQRSMVWFALFGMLLYPFFIVLSSFLKLDNAATLISNIAPTYFISTSIIVMVFFGAEELVKVFLNKKFKE